MHRDKLNVLVGCEASGTVRDAFAARGHNAWSCDILPSSSAGNHIVGDLLELLHNDRRRKRWDILIAHPPCDYLCCSGLHWTTRGLRDPQLTEDALEFVRSIMAAPIPHIAVENPTGCISTRIGDKFAKDRGFTGQKATQYVQPYEFGHDASKRTGLWLKGLPPLKPTKYIPPRMVNGKPRWANQTDSGQNRLGPGKDRAAKRAKTYEGIADAMVKQWEEHCLKIHKKE